MQHLRLSAGLMPSVGLGTWKAAPGVVASTVEDAIRAGYRHLDCACDYGNEHEVGAGIKAALDAGICKREDLFITSKLWNTYHAKEHVEPACKKSLSDLGLDYLDLYLIHFPISLKYVPFETRYPPEWIHDPNGSDPKMEVVPVPISETWGAMEKLVNAGLVKNIGVANFRAVLLMDLLATARIPPAVNQVEIHPFLVEEQLVDYCKKAGIVVTAFSPLGAGSYVSIGMANEKETVLKNESVLEIAERIKKSPAQVVLRWAIQRGISVIPKSTNPERLRQNLDVFSFELTDTDMTKISSLGERRRRYNDPGEFCKGMGCDFMQIHG